MLRHTISWPIRDWRAFYIWFHSLLLIWETILIWTCKYIHTHISVSFNFQNVGIFYHSTSTLFYRLGIFIPEFCMTVIWNMGNIHNTATPKLPVLCSTTIEPTIEHRVAANKMKDDVIMNQKQSTKFGPWGGCCHIWQSKTRRHILQHRQHNTPTITTTAYVVQHQNPFSKL